MLKQIDGPAGTSTIAAAHAVLGAYHLYCEGEAPLLFTENSTNHAKLHLDYPDVGPYLKDGINDYVVQGRREAVNPERHGTKAAAHYRLTIGPGRSATVRLRLTAQAPAGSRTPTKGSAVPFGKDFDETLAARLREADAFYTVGDPALGLAGCGQRDAPGHRRHALVQAVLLLGRRCVAGGAPRPSPAPWQP